MLVVCAFCLIIILRECTRQHACPARPSAQTQIPSAVLLHAAVSGSILSLRRLSHLPHFLRNTKQVDCVAPSSTEAPSAQCRLHDSLTPWPPTSQQSRSCCRPVRTRRRQSQVRTCSYFQATTTGMILTSCSSSRSCVARGRTEAQLLAIPPSYRRRRLVPALCPPRQRSRLQELHPAQLD